jgi:hypothetical protein
MRAHGAHALNTHTRTLARTHTRTHVRTHVRSFVREFDPEVTGCTAAGIKKFRELCEASLTAAGLHVTEAGRLW